MPIKNGRDSKGSYYAYGNQKRYYYISGDAKSRILAMNKAKKQMKAILATGYREKH